MHGNRRIRFPRDITRMQHPIPARQLRNASDRELEQLERAIRDAIDSGHTGPYHFVSLEESLLNIDEVRDARMGDFGGGGGDLDEDGGFEELGEDEEHHELGGGFSGHGGGDIPGYGGGRRRRGGRGGTRRGVGYGHPHMSPNQTPKYAYGMHPGMGNPGMGNPRMGYPGMGHPSMGHPPMYGNQEGPPMGYGMPAGNSYKEAPHPGRPHGPFPSFGAHYAPPDFAGSHGAQYLPSGFGGSPGNPYFSSASPQPPHRPARKQGPDLYAALGLTKSATKKQIEKEGKRLKMQWHPDRNKEDGAEEKFKLINEATEVLSDDERRRFYDETGDTNLNTFEDWKRAMGGSGARRGRRPF